ncbi:acetoacetyl-CoA reductase [Francisellaceae bacterium]|nr:acetoacetyl-CoA reductase [Francisellaceae bacterium]
MKGRIAVVTGGTRGIGKAICDALLKEGAFVIAGYTNEANAQKWLDSQKEKGYGDKVDIIKGDVSNPDEVRAAIVEKIEKYGKIEILVNNAGITRDGMFKKMTYQQWSEVMNTNLGSLFSVSQPVINSMLENGFGRVVNMSSVNAQKGQLGQVNYSAAKSGIHGFTKALAQEVARKDITVNTVSPGYVATEMVMAIPEPVLEKIVAQVPKGRLATPEEVASLVTFLCSDNAGFITGADYSINGGLHMS